MNQHTEPKNIVLYADDDPDDLYLVTSAFKKYAHNVDVVTVNDGIEALSYLNNLSPLDPKPCLIILDVNMPRMNGKETLRNIRSLKNFEEIPVVLFTTSSMPQDGAFARQYNAGFITKPLDVRQMDIITDEFISNCADDIRHRLKRIQ